MERENPPIERRWFETREECMHYVALARGFKDADEMRSKMAPLNGGSADDRIESRNDDLKRRLSVAKLSEVK